MAEPIIVDLLRHGEVAGEAWVARGSTDTPLSEAGWEQMRAIGKALQGVNLTCIGSSPLSRCRQFAEEMGGRSYIPVGILDDMREMDFGAWEGKGADDIADQTALKRFLEDPQGFCPPQGEPFDDFVERVVRCWKDWLAGADGEHRLLVTHSGVLRVLLVQVLGMPVSRVWRLHLPYAAWCRVSLLAGAQPRLLFMNRHPA